jgi:hypothetical protein
MVSYRLPFILPLCTMVLAKSMVAPYPNPSSVKLGTASDYAILSQAGVSTVPTSAIIGNVGVSPISGGALTGFSLVTSDPSRSTSTQITGVAHAADYLGDTPAILTKAISDMLVAYTDAASRATSGAAALNVGGGSITGKIFDRGVYTWGSDVSFTDEIYIRGTAHDIFIFQMSGNLVVASNAKIVLQGGARAENIVWQVAGYVQAAPDSHLEGVFLIKTKGVFQTRTSLNGRIMSQTAVTLDQSTITMPPYRAFKPVIGKPDEPTFPVKPDEGSWDTDAFPSDMPEQPSEPFIDTWDTDAFPSDMPEQPSEPFLDSPVDSEWDNGNSGTTDDEKSLNVPNSKATNTLRTWGNIGPFGGPIIINPASS